MRKRLRYLINMKGETMKTVQTGNNEYYGVGIALQPDGTYLALTSTKSKYFKTKAGAVKWLKKFTNKNN